MDGQFTGRNLDWVHFHNGVACGLQLLDASSLTLDAEWLHMNLLDHGSMSSAGLLFAFGLLGHTNRLSRFDVHERLIAGNQVMSIAVLLAFAIARRGSRDSTVIAH